MTHLEIDFTKHCKALFGSYVKAHDDPDVTNDVNTRTRPCIALGPSGNRQGSTKVFCITTGVVLKCRKITEFPMSDRVIAKVNKWGERTKQEKYGKKLHFLNRHKLKFDWDNEELSEYEGLTEDPPKPHPEIVSELPGIELEAEQIEEAPAIEEIDMTDSQAAIAAVENTGMPEITGVNNGKSIITGVLDTIDEVTDEEK